MLLFKEEKKRKVIFLENCLTKIHFFNHTLRVCSLNIQKNNMLYISYILSTFIVTIIVANFVSQIHKYEKL